MVPVRGGRDRLVFSTDTTVQNAYSNVYACVGEGGCNNPELPLNHFEVGA